MQNINSNFIENILEQEGKIDLLEAFKVMVGCNHGILFNSQSKNVKYNNPDHQYYEYRQTLIDKKDEVIALAEKLGINATPLYDSFFHPWKKHTFDENIVTLTCKELGITQKELDGIRKPIVEGLHKYYTEKLESIKMTKNEVSELLKHVRDINEKYDTTPEIVSQLLNGEISILDGKVSKIVSIDEAFADMPYFKDVFKKNKQELIDTSFITPLFLKQFCKEKEWTYKDLAEHIGAVEGTVRSWVVKGEIPEWAKKSIAYILKIDTFKLDNESSLSKLEDLKNAWQTLNDILLSK